MDSNFGAIAWAECIVCSRGSNQMLFGVTQYLMGPVIGSWFKKPVVAHPSTWTNPYSAANDFRVPPAMYDDGVSFCLQALQGERCARSEPSIGFDRTRPLSSSRTARTADEVADLFVDDVSYLHEMHLDRCTSTVEAAYLGKLMPLRGLFVTRDFGLSKEFAVNWTKAIDLFVATPEFAALENEYFRIQEQCEMESDEVERIKLQDVTGLFLLVGTIGAMALIAALASAASARRHGRFSSTKLPATEGSQTHSQMPVRSVELPAKMPMDKSSCTSSDELPNLKEVADDPHMSERDMIRALILHAHSKSQREQANHDTSLRAIARARAAAEHTDVSDVAVACGISF